MILRSKSYLQYRRRAPESAVITIDPEWVLSSHKWHRWRDALIQIVGFHAEWTWRWNIVGCQPRRLRRLELHWDWQNSGKNYWHFHGLVRDWNRPRRWTSSWKRARLLLEIDPYSFFCSIQLHFLWNCFLSNSEALSYHLIFLLFLFCKEERKKGESLKSWWTSHQNSWG